MAFCFAELRYSLSEFHSWKICQHFLKWTRWNKRDQVRSSANSLFKLPSTHLLLLRLSILNVNVYAGAFLSTFQRVLVKTKLWRNTERDLKQKIYIHSLMYVIYKRPRLFPAPLLTVVRISYRHILTSGLGNHFFFPLVVINKFVLTSIPGGGILPIMAFTAWGDSTRKGYPFQASGILYGRDFTCWSIWRAETKICQFGL